MVQLSPRGTRGAELPKFLKAMPDPGNLMFRMGFKIMGLPLIRLTTVGARTGKQRRKVLAWFPDNEGEESGLIVGSNGGSARHPGWAHNLVKHPHTAAMDRGKGPIPVSAQLLVGAERDTAWRRVVDRAERYQRYTTKTDREIPIFRLSIGQS